MRKQTRKHLAKPIISLPASVDLDSGHAHSQEDCRQMLTTLGEYVDGALTPDLCTELERHMQGCQRCRIVVDTLKKTIELYHETGEETHMPSEVRQRLYARLNLEDYQK